jgi:hypothetical protein
MRGEAVKHYEDGRVLFKFGDNCYTFPTVDPSYFLHVIAKPVPDIGPTLAEIAVIPQVAVLIEAAQIDPDDSPYMAPTFSHSLRILSKRLIEYGWLPLEWPKWLKMKADELDAALAPFMICPQQQEDGCCGNPANVPPDDSEEENSE